MLTKLVVSLYRRWGVRSLGAKLLFPSVALGLLSLVGTSSFFFLRGTEVTHARLFEQEAARESDYVLGKLAQREDAIWYAGSLLARDPDVAEVLGQHSQAAMSTLNGHAVLVRDRFDLGLFQMYDEDAVARTSLVLSSASSLGTSTRSLLDLAESGAPVARVIDDRLLLLRRFPLPLDAGTVVVGIDLATELARIHAQGRLTSDLKLRVRDHTVSTSDDGVSSAGGVPGSRTASVPDHHVTVEALDLGSTPAELILERRKGDIELVTRTGLIVSLAGVLVTTVLLSGLHLMVMRAVERPTVALSQAAMRVADGDLQARVRLAQNTLAIGDNDEVGDLAESFNQMVDRLSELCADMEAKVAARTAELETAAELARAASSSLESSSIVRQATQIIRQRLGTRVPGLHRVGVYAVEEGSEEALLIEAVSGDREQVSRTSGRVPLGAATPIGLAVTTRRPQALLNTRLATAPVKPPLLLDTSSAAAVPLVIGEEVIGVLSLESKEPNAFGPETMDLLATVADQLAAGVYNAKQYERQRYAAQHCVDYDRAKSEFLRTIHLELRTSVDTVNRLSERLLRHHHECLCDLQREDLRRIHVSTERLQRIVDALSDVYLVDPGDVTLRPEPVNVRDAIERAVGAAIPLLEAKENSLLTDLHSAPSTIRADGSALRQIVFGLLSTAAAIGKAGCIEVRARSVEVFYDDTDCQDPLLLVTVSHPAARVPREELARLCRGPLPPEGEVLHQSPVPVGPGFPMARRLVEMQGGRIWTENGNGRGMSFSFILPMDASRTGGARHVGLSARSREWGEDTCVD